MKNLVTLHITTFMGVSAGAEHWYGEWWIDTSRRISDKNGRISSRTGFGCRKHPLDRKSVLHVLSAKEAKNLNKKEEFTWAPAYRNLHVKGEVSGRFETKTELIKAAKQSFIELFKVDDLLIMDEGDYNYIAIAGPDDVVEAYNQCGKSHEKRDKMLDDFGYLPPIEYE